MAKLIDITGKALSGEWGNDDETGTGIHVLRTTNFTNDGIINYENVVTRQIPKKDLSKKYLCAGDIIIEKSGGSDNQPVGRVVYFDGENNKYLFNNFTGVLRVIDTEKWLPRYVFYALYANYMKGGTRPFENKTTGLHNLKTDSYVSSTEIAELPFKEQTAIVNMLDKLTTLISLRKQQLLKLDELVKSRFIELFGDPEYNEKQWAVLKLETLCSVSSSKRIYQNELSAEGVPFLRISDLVNRMDTGSTECELYIPEERYEELKVSGLVPVAGDMLLTARGTLGRCYTLTASDKFYFQDGMITWLYGFDKKLTTNYLTHLFSMSGFRKQIDSLQAGSTVAYLSIAMTKKLDVMLPPIELQNQFTTFVEQTDKSQLAIQKSLEKLETLKKALMQKYFGRGENYTKTARKLHELSLAQ